MMVVRAMDLNSNTIYAFCVYEAPNGRVGEITQAPSSSSPEPAGSRRSSVSPSISSCWRR